MEAAVEGIQASGGPIGIVGIIALVFTGIGWVESIRSSQRAFYGSTSSRATRSSGGCSTSPCCRWSSCGLIVSVAASTCCKSLLRWLSGGGSDWLTMVSAILTVPVNMVLAVALLGAVPRLRISPRRRLRAGDASWRSASRCSTRSAGTTSADRHNPAYAVVATAVGLLVYLYLFNQVLLFGAALAATDIRGNVIDLAADPPRQQQEDTFQQRLAEENRRSDHQEDTAP